MALDNQLRIVMHNIGIQSDALQVMRLQKVSARVTELAVRRFEARLLNTRALRFGILQQIEETENRINFLVGRFPQPVSRISDAFGQLLPATVLAGIPAQLRSNRPDIRQAALELMAAKLDVKAARAQFYPRLSISAGIGFRAFNSEFLVKSPESLLYSLVGELAAPLINRNAIKAAYYTTNARQLQTIYEYECTILGAYIEVANQMSHIANLKNTYALRKLEVKALNASIDISNSLFKSAWADYMEALLTQRDALESRFELVETRKNQLQAVVHLYQALGGGRR